MTPEQITLLNEWQLAKQEAVRVAPIVAREMALRKAVVASFWPTPAEGTNNQDLNAGWKLKYVHSFDYKVDDAALPLLREELAKEQVSLDGLFKYSAALVLKEYRTLGDNIKSKVDQVLTIKPKSPTLELIPPKEQ